MKKTLSQLQRNAWSWIPSLYFAEGLPYVVVMTVSVIMYKRLDISNTDIALYTSWLYLPWVIKPFWSPFVDMVKSKRWWIVSMQLLIGAGFGGIGLLLPLPLFFQSTLCVFWLMAFSSATHDIAADGFYMLALDEKKQSFFVGIRSTFYRFSTLAGQGLLIVLAGILEKKLGNIALAWSIVFYILAAFFLCMCAYHHFALPYPLSDTKRSIAWKDVLKRFLETFSSFFKKKHIGWTLAFMMLYRLGEALLVKMASPFLLDERSLGGLGLSTEDVGYVYGTVGVIALTLGGILGGIVVSKGGLSKWLWPMALSITLPNIVYVFLSHSMPLHIWPIYTCVAIEQFGYGFGFTAYMLYMMRISEGAEQTAHYALCTGFMALGMMLPGMIAGWLQESVGYPRFFEIVMVLSLPILCIIPIIKKQLNKQE